MATPFLFGLRNVLPDRNIDVVGCIYVADIFRRCSAIDRLLEYDRRRGIGAEISVLRRNRPENGWEVSFVLPRSFSSALVSFLSGAKRRIGYGGDCRSFLLTDTLPGSDFQSEHLSHIYMRLIEKISGKQVEEVPLPVVVPPYEWREVVKRKGLSEEYVVLAPGATYGSAKLWPPDRYASLASRIVDKFQFPIVTIGKSEERPVGSHIIESVGVEGRNLAGECTIEELLAVLRGAYVVIGNDSGPVHLSAAMGRPTVTIFGSSSPAWTAPRGMATEIVKGEVECAPCFNRECPEKDPRCLLAIGVNDVYNAALRLIGEDHIEKS